MAFHKNFVKIQTKLLKVFLMSIVDRYMYVSQICLNSLKIKIFNDLIEDLIEVLFVKFLGRISDLIVFETIV